MRLAGIEKGGYYPYPPNMAEATASWFIPLPAGTRGRLLDPCAGEGEIANLFGKLLNCETWGCELFPYRAEIAASRMDKCHSTTWESCSLTDESVRLLWLNPPYDDDRHGDELGGAIVPAEEGDFITELAREVLCGVKLDDLQSLFADEMNISNSPMGCPTETSPVLIPVKPKTWQEWVLEHQLTQAAQRRTTGKRRAVVQPGQLSIWSKSKEE